MRKQLVRSICLCGLSATALLLWQQPAQAADDGKTIEIVFPGPVFSPVNVSISKGQTIKWVTNPKDDATPHQLVSDPGTEKDLAFDTGEFTTPDTASHKFEKAGVIKYHCEVHPGTMKGTITVQ